MQKRCSDSGCAGKDVRKNNCSGDWVLDIIFSRKSDLPFVGFGGKVKSLLEELLFIFAELML
jgi:hypothetical protein